MPLLYILRCRDKTLYTGITTDLKKRIKQHNGLISGGAKYTRGRGPVKLVYSEKLKTKSLALKREHQVKSLSRPEKLKLIRTKK